jgi:hypothetical protein
LVEGERIGNSSSLYDFGEEEGEVVASILVFKQFKGEGVEDPLGLCGLTRDVRLHFDDLVVEEREPFVEGLLGGLHL